MKIGVFDSGVGGRSFIAPIQQRFPQADIVYKEDRENVPYGDKTPEQLYELSLPIFQQFEDEGCDAVVVACNTLTTNSIARLRVALSIPLVGVEPMIKPAAAMTSSGVVAVCATRGTLQSARYAHLKEQYAQDIRVVEPDCSHWAYLIERNKQNELELHQTVDELKRQNVDVVVLGCTHYHWIEDELRSLCGPNITVIQPIEPVLNQLERITQTQ